MENNLVLKKIPGDYALKHRILPLDDTGNQVVVAMTEAGSRELLKELQFVLGATISVEIWPEDRLLTAICAAYNLQPPVENGIEDTADSGFHFIEKQQTNGRPESETDRGEDRSVINLVNRFISKAIQMKASDIHVESYEDQFRIRFRIDGKLMPVDVAHKGKRQAIVSRLKIMADMDIAEKRRPQDGRIRMANGAKKVDIRVSTMPTDFGEKVVLRILDKSSLSLSLDNLGIDNSILLSFKKVLQMPYGMVLVTGPTGSGKTTSLYAALQFLNRPEINVITIEDPIEYNLPGINQTMVRSDIGLAFSGILRTVLRQDPNVIMLGEIRDSETAEIAVRSALTGHMVLSTLHTNDAISTIVRLVDMGIEPFLVANSLKMVLAQRLIRKICQNCRGPAPVDWQRYQNYNLPDDIQQHVFYRGAGCGRCNNTGYQGREAVIEALVIDDDFAGQIMAGATMTDLRRLAAAKGLKHLNDIALQRALDGRTTLAEVVSETFVG